MDDTRNRFQNLLRELFQFDCSDLDFGIYRIMNYKRNVLNQFIEKDLPKSITKQLSGGQLASQSAAVEELETLKAQILENIADDAIDAEGNLLPQYHKTKLGKQYLKLKPRVQGAKPTAALETAVFNHLYSFFSRYYDAADFMPLRRYSKKQKYAIPYNGEEVCLHWANKDQYYIKTGEYFKDYTFETGGFKVHFKLRKADVPKDNLKGDKRFFLVFPKDSEIDPKIKQILIPVEYRSLTEQEAITFSTKNQQDKIIDAALEVAKKAFKKEDAVLTALFAEKRKNSDNQTVSFLEHYLRQYTRRNSSDFFIHKNLRGFLEQELDFYLKNEVLHLDELQAGGEDRAEGWFQLLCAIKSIGHDIIAFLSQLENFQKILFEKKKFIYDTQYCITTRNVPEQFYPHIADNENQWTEWKELLAIDKEQENLFTAKKNKTENRIEFLKSHATLVLDTRHFEADFVDELLAGFEDIDGMTDGLCIHSDNWQALNLMLEKYLQKVTCVHIDPPYNTETSGFLYKNSYQHSSWLAMMENLIALSSQYVSKDGSFLCHIDENEYERLHIVFDNFLIPNAGTVTWDKRNPMNAGRGIATQHEYIVWRSNKETPLYFRNEGVHAMLNAAKNIINKHGGVTEKARREYAAWVNNNDQLSGGEKAYRYLDEDGQVYQSVSLRAPEPRADKKFHIPLNHPITGKPCPTPPNGFSRTPETLKKMIKDGEIIFGQNESIQPRQKVVLTEQKQRQVSSVIQDGHKGKADLDRLGLDFPYCHPVSLYRKLIGAAVGGNDNIVFDYFAGSGTTAHSTINLNQSDGCNYRFILVEMGEYFDSIILPRIKKVSFSPEWQGGKPKRLATDEEAQRSPRIVKYYRLESYEDALNNIRFDETKGQQFMHFNRYLLDYMLDFETKDNETFLNVDKLANPFDYKLLIHQDGQTLERPVDLLETFNYLIGLHVQTRRTYQNGKIKYLVFTGTVEHKKITVIWRTTENWKQKDYETDKAFIETNELTKGADEVYINSDSLIPNAQSLDPVFKNRMFSEVTHG